jgi:hypothetical protein
MLHIPHSYALVVLLMGWLGTCAVASGDESAVVKKKKTSESLRELLGQHNGKLPLLDEYKRGFWTPYSNSNCQPPLFCIPDLFPSRLYSVYTQIDADELLSAVEDHEDGKWASAAITWAIRMGLDDFDASAQAYPSIARIYPELHAYVRESVERVKDVDAKFFVLKLLVFFNDVEKRQGQWQGLDGLIFAHRSTCEELPAVYHQLSDTAKAELFAAFELTDLVGWIRDRRHTSSHPSPT